MSVCECVCVLDASGSVVVSKLDKQTCRSEFESHWVPHSFSLVPHLSKKLSKLLYICGMCVCDSLCVCINNSFYLKINMIELLETYFYDNFAFSLTPNIPSNNSSKRQYKDSFNK